MSTYQLNLLHDLEPKLHKYLDVDTDNSSEIKIGDLIEMKLSDQTVILMDDDEVTSTYKFIGVSNSAWSTGIIDYALRKRIEIITVGVFEATVVSGTYQIGDALQYDVTADDGTLESWETGNQLIGWVWECGTGTITTLKVYIDVRDASVNLFEASS